MLDVLTGLGNGYDLSAAGPAPLLIGGGAGVPPLYWLCRELVRRSAEPFVVLGFIPQATCSANASSASCAAAV